MRNHKNLDPKCRLCWDKGYSTEYVGVSGVVHHYCSCEKGSEMNPKTIIHKSPTQTVYSDGTSERSPNSEYLTYYDEYDLMKRDAEKREVEKKASPLDEFIEEVKSILYEESDGPFIDSEVALDILEESIRLAVKKHAEAVIPEKPSNFFLSSKDTLDEIKQKSDTWRGV